MRIVAIALALVLAIPLMLQGQILADGKEQRPEGQERMTREMRREVQTTRPPQDEEGRAKLVLERKVDSLLRELSTFEQGLIPLGRSQLTQGAFTWIREQSAKLSRVKGAVEDLETLEEIQRLNRHLSQLENQQKSFANRYSFLIDFADVQRLMARSSGVVLRIESMLERLKAQDQDISQWQEQLDAITEEFAELELEVAKIGRQLTAGQRVESVEIAQLRRKLTATSNLLGQLYRDLQ